ncbi:hypothetical protein BC939DRAFT_533289 [Gamsiella multidivaricata]|uniref:uncharacterized protein n=1 Tax=Gamsiella multidivaricata TaxID=101098 RepID=UPI002220C558|nr:uncharacterized protein BC939DRAFT_533289 [Gamsiella multidivaricata]KAG0367417.1 hypothetical protein BGZ54_003911 [Gamsiella multidivaricata]KAI7816777.1 hypothetical protein BC939DRAFT_533289 [Gamsiella multidivaricata]
MDIGEKWACADLETLHIRIHSLDTEEKIDRTIQLWKDRALKSNRSPGHIDTAFQHDNSIEAQVAQYLLRYKKLHRVWLGYRVYKDWMVDFTYPIWDTIDFATDTKLQDFGQDVPEKYGHHIRIVKNLKEQPHLNTILRSKASKLKQLATIMQGIPSFQAYLYDIIYQIARF